MANIYKHMANVYNHMAMTTSLAHGYTWLVHPDTTSGVKVQFCSGVKV